MGSLPRSVLSLIPGPYSSLGHTMCVTSTVRRYLRKDRTCSKPLNSPQASSRDIWESAG
jgi:hypothetical protein